LVLATTTTALLFAFAATAGAATTTKTVDVDPARVYTPTGITVQTGDVITIEASGEVQYGGGPIAHLDPEGIPWGPQCAAIADRQQRGHPWPAPGSPCWSVIARVGKGDPVEIGKGATFTAENDGPLRVGVNDNFAGDNSGTMTAKVTVTPAGEPASSGGGGSSNAVIFIVIGVLVLLGLLLLFFFLRRRRSDDDDDGDDEAMAPVPAPEPAPVVAAAAAVPEPEPVPAPPLIPNAPPDPESIDVNIFEVEFVNGLQLRIGYNHFPDGTPVNWKVTQSRKPVAVGSFVAEGGGSTNHFETAVLGVKLEGREAHPDGADVQFDWSINGVPFRYSVRRDPNC
jgi:MYXO-CTERM domain-containing protein